MKNTSIIGVIVEDFRSNSHLKSKFILLLYRVAHLSGVSSSRIIYHSFLPYRFAYRLIVDWILGVDIPWKVSLGRQTILFHSCALVINESVKLGNGCILRHSVTIGNKLSPSGETLSPRVGDRVEFGAGCIVIGDVSIGDDAVIGAGAVVTKNVPPGAIMVGNPARQMGGKNG